MKIRSDFVTNSSSSSFVIGKNGDKGITVEFVYSLVRDIYNELIQKRDRLIDYIKNDPEFGIYYCEKEKNFNFFCYKDDFKNEYARRMIDKMIENDFGLSMDYLYEKNYDWLKCKTYKKYENYWRELYKKTKDNSLHGPFTIASFVNNKKILWPHISGDCYENCDIDSSSDIATWYYPYINEAINCNESCDHCSKKSLYFDKNECMETRRNIIENNIPHDHVCLHLLGKVCIYSCCGYIPEYVVERLYDISEFACVHMG